MLVIYIVIINIWTKLSDCGTIAINTWLIFIWQNNHNIGKKMTDVQNLLYSRAWKSTESRYVFTFIFGIKNMKLKNNIVAHLAWS